MTGFWEAFWPNFASTLIGLLLGLPFALWTDRQITARSERRQRKEERNRLANSLDTLSRALSFNRERLKCLVQSLSNNRAPFDPALDYSAWDAVKSEIIQHLHNPTLQQRIAYHFSRMEAVTKLSDLYLNYVAGIGATIGGSEQMRDSLRGYLLNTLQQLDIESEQIMQAIQAAMDGHV